MYYYLPGYVGSSWLQLYFLEWQGAEWWSDLKPYRSAIVCLQEAHLKNYTISLLKFRAYQTQFHSMHFVYSRGVSILISNDVPFHLLHPRIDDEERYIFLLCKRAEMLCIVANIYVLPPFSPDSLCLAQFIAPHSNLPIWVLGDFDHFLDRTLDKSTPPGGRSIGPGGPTPFARLISEVGLSVVSRDRYPDKVTPAILLLIEVYPVLIYVFCNSLAQLSFTDWLCFT